MRIQDLGIILLLFVIVGQIVAEFLVIRISTQQNVTTFIIKTYLTTAASNEIANVTNDGTNGKEWHDVETLTFTIETVRTASSPPDYLICMNRDPEDGKINHKDAKRLSTILRRWRCRMKKILNRIEALFLSACARSITVSSSWQQWL